jgi:hypothetical protein
MLHNVLFSGSQFDLPFETEVGSIRVWPDSLTLYSDECQPLHIKSQLALDQFELRAAGLNVPQHLEDLAVSLSAPYTHTITVADLATKLVVEVRGEPGIDIDLVVYFDEDGDGIPDEELARSDSPGGTESVELGGILPAGDYLAVVESLAMPPVESTFDLSIDMVSGSDLSAEKAPSAVEPGVEYSFDVCANPPSEAEEPQYGMVVFGPGGAPGVLTVPVTWRSEHPEVKIYLPRAVLNEATAEPTLEPTPDATPEATAEPTPAAMAP